MKKVDPRKVVIDSLFCDVCQKKTQELVILTEEPVFEICRDCIKKAQKVIDS